MNKKIIMDEKKVIYGLQKITINQKRTKISNLFENVSSDYDKMNDLMSLGTHRIWKKDLVDRLEREQFVSNRKTILDLAGGTGDIAFALKNRFPQNEITIMDLTPGMMKIGKKKALKKNLHNGLNWVAGDSAYLPFAQSTFNNITCAFGIRNVAEIDKTLEGCYKVLKPGGKLMILEFSPEVIVPFQKFYEYYLKNVLPFLGDKIANNKEAYQYLAESIETFYNPNDFCDILESVKFKIVKLKKYLSGTACLYIATRI